MAPRTLEEMLASLEEIARNLQRQAAAAADGESVEPLEAIRQAFEERTWAEQRLAARVADARAAGISWTAIGSMLGTTGEAARQRYRTRP